MKGYTEPTKIESYFETAALGIFTAIAFPIIAAGVVVLFPFWLLGKAVGKERRSEG